MGKLQAFLMMFCPSKVKIFLLRLLGHDIDYSAYIGFSYLHIKKISLGKTTYIGHGNIFTNLSEICLQQGSRINRWNRFTSSPAYIGQLVIGERSSIALRHYFDVCDLVEIGSDTIIAGHRSTFFTHSKGIEQIDYVKPIRIGDWCYVGSNVCCVPGATVGHHTFVAMGAVLVGDHASDTYVLLAGNPAKPRKKLDVGAAYFRQGQLRHAHH